MITDPQHLASKFPPIVHIYTDVLRVLANAPKPMTATQLAAATGRDKSNVRRDLQKLKEAGVLTLDSEGAFITDDGVAWVRGQAVAEGLESPAPRSADMASSIRLAGHANFRPNPDQPRKDFDDAVIRGIADTMAADAESGGKGILQPLLVRPRDPNDPLDGDEANPVRMIWAGEQRWRAIALLIAEGRLPAALDPERGGGIPFEERAEPPGGAAFLALVENGARSDLDPLDEAFAFLDYVTRENLSARQAAINTGRAAKGEGGVRTVQIRIKVAKEATPEAIAEYRRTKDWNALVDSVQRAGETFEERRERDIRKGVAGLMGRRRLALIELAHKAVIEPDETGTGRSAVARWQGGDPTGAITALVQHAGAVFGGGSGRISDVARAWLIEQGLLDIEAPRETLAAAWREHGLLETTIADRLAADPIIWSTEWLNSPPPPAAPEEPTMFDLPPAKPAAALSDILPGRSVITLAEIIHLSPDHGQGAALPMAQAAKYWLDQNVSVMKDAGLITIVHEPAQPPFVRITDAGLDAFHTAVTERTGGELGPADGIDQSALDFVRDAWGQAAWPGPGMVTDWLNIEAARGIEVVCPVADTAEDRIEIDFSLPGDDVEDERTVVDILGADALREIVFAADPGDAGRAFLSGLFDRVGFKGPFVASQREVEEGLIHDAVGRCVLTCDVEGDETAAMAHAQAIVVAAALNAVLGLAVDLTPQAGVEAA